LKELSPGTLRDLPLFLQIIHAYILHMYSQIRTHAYIITGNKIYIFSNKLLQERQTQKTLQFPQEFLNIHAAIHHLLLVLYGHPHKQGINVPEEPRMVPGYNFTDLHSSTSQY